MNKIRTLLKASFIQLRIYLLCIIGMVVVSFIVNIITSLAVDTSSNTQVSAGNTVTVFLIFLPIVVSMSFFKRSTHMGATRKEYYISALANYAGWAAIFSLLNVLWFKFESNVVTQYMNTFNILTIFHWDELGFAGMLFYQFGTYLLLISLLNLLFSGVKHYASWVLWFVLIAAISVGTSVPVLRGHVADAFLTLLFNDSLLQGVGLTLLLSCLFFLGGWWFIKRRVF